MVKVQNIRVFLSHLQSKLIFEASALDLMDAIGDHP